MMFSKSRFWTCLTGLLICATSSLIAAGEPTAFQLAKEGNRYVGEQAKDKVIQVPLDLSKLQDSDKAIAVALKEPLVEKLSIQATGAKLERGEGGLPVWKIRLWAAKLRHPTDLVDIGEVILSAEDGKVIKDDLNISKVD